MTTDVEAVQVLMRCDVYHMLLSLVYKTQGEWEERLAAALREGKDIAYCEAQLRALDNLIVSLKIGLQ